MELLIFYGEDVLILSTGRKPDPSTTLRDPMKTGSVYFDKLSNRMVEPSIVYGPFDYAQGSCGDERPEILRGRKTSEPAGTKDQ